MGRQNGSSSLALRLDGASGPVGPGTAAATEAAAEAATATAAEPLFPSATPSTTTSTMTSAAAAAAAATSVSAREVELIRRPSFERIASSRPHAGDSFNLHDVKVLQAHNEGVAAGLAHLGRDGADHDGDELDKESQASHASAKPKASAEMGTMTQGGGDRRGRAPRKTKVRRFTLRSALFMNVVHMANQNRLGGVKQWKKVAEDALGCLGLISLVLVFASVELFFNVNGGVPLTHDIFGDPVVLNTTWEALTSTSELEEAWKWVVVNSSFDGTCTPQHCSDLVGGASCCEQYVLTEPLTWDVVFADEGTEYIAGCVFAGLMEAVTLAMCVLVWVKFFFHVQITAIKHGQMLRFDDKAYLVQTMVEFLVCLAHVPYPISYLMQEEHDDQLYYYPLLTFNIVLVLLRLYSVAYLLKNHPGFECNTKFAHAMGVESDSIVFVLKMLCQSNPALIFWPMVLIDLGVVALPVYVLERAVPHGNIDSFGVAVWFAFISISSVGFGDYYPLTAVGQAVVVVGAVVMGIVILGLTTAFLVDFTLLTPNEEEVVSEIRMCRWKEKQAHLHNKYVTVVAVRKWLHFYMYADQRHDNELGSKESELEAGTANEEVERDESLINISAVDPGVKQALMDIGDRVQRDADECDSEGNPLPNAEDNEEDRQPRLGPGNDPRRHDGQTREVNSPPDQRDSGKTAHLPKPSHSVAAKYARSSDCRSLAELCQSRRRRFKEVLIRVQRIEQNSRRKARENTASQPILLNGVRRVLMQDRMQRTLQVKLDQIVSKQNDLKAILLTLNERLEESVGEMVKRDEEQKQNKPRRKSRGRRSHQPRSSDVGSGGTPHRGAHHSQASHDSDNVGANAVTPLEDALQYDFGRVDDSSAVGADGMEDGSKTSAAVAPGTYDGIVGMEDFPAALDSIDSSDDEDGDDVWDRNNEGDEDSEDDEDNEAGQRQNHEDYGNDGNDGSDSIGQLQLSNQEPDEHAHSKGSPASLPDLHFSRPLRKTPSPDGGAAEVGHVRRISSDSVDLVDPDHRRLFSMLHSESGENQNDSSSSENGQPSKHDKT